jgi:hypothetical protein
MTTEQQFHLKDDFDAFTALNAARECRRKIAAVGVLLSGLGQALQEHPEDVTPLPEPQSGSDYRDALNALDRQKIIDLCKELRALIQVANQAEKRKGLLVVDV